MEKETLPWIVCLKNVSRNLYLSENIFAGDGVYAWRVSSYYGQNGADFQDRDSYVRYVRGNSLPKADFTRSGSKGVVKETQTQLMWQDDIEAKAAEKIWVEAIHYCESSVLSGYDDWRLPNIRELKSIVDIDTVDPSIDKAFINVASEGYWSYTAHKDYEKNAWAVQFANASDYMYRKNKSYHVRCVRGDD